MNVRLTSALPDEEDKWFVTDVSGAPLQVIGVREPSGELFPVIGVTKRGLCALERLKLEAETGAKVEVITGPEAVRVIESFIIKPHEQRWRRDAEADP